MSGDGPESIPTSADPRSRRPVKKRALTPVSAQAATVDALFAKPDQEIRIPVGAGNGEVARRHVAGAGAGVGGAPPEIISNVQGSSSGAGSGEFHVYKASRRREYARLRQLDEAAQRDRDKSEFEAAKKEREARDDEKTRKNREKRDKAKARKAKAKAGGGANGAAKANKRPAAAAAAATSGSSTPMQTDAGAASAKDAAAEPSKAATTTNNDSSGSTAPPPPPIALAPLPVDNGPGLLIQDDD